MSFLKQVEASREPVKFMIGKAAWYCADLPAAQIKPLLAALDTEVKEEQVEAGFTLLKTLLVDKDGNQYPDLLDLTVEGIDDVISPRLTAQLTRNIISIITGNDTLGN